MTKQKNKSWVAYLVLACIALIAIAYAYQPAWFNSFMPSQQVVNQPTPQPTIAAGTVSVTKPIKIVANDELAGGVLDGTTSAIKLYANDGHTLLETLSLSSGSVTSANSYPSNTQLWIEYYYDTTIDAYNFWHMTVPQMTPADAESLTSNTIAVSTREAGAYTDSLMTSGGLTFTDGSVFNQTAAANQTGTMTYNLYTTSDNTGYPQFFDPIYQIDVKPVVWATLSGGSYTSISLTGFDGSFEKGTTMYYYKVMAPNDVSKQKVGNMYTIAGVGAVTFGFDASGWSNATAATYTTLQMYLEIYSSPTYMDNHGTYGPYVFVGAEQTVLFEDI